MSLPLIEINCNVRFRFKYNFLGNIRSCFGILYLLLVDNVRFRFKYNFLGNIRSCFGILYLLLVEPGGTQKINLLQKAGGRVVYYGYKNQRKVEKKFSNFNEKLKGVVKKDKKIERNTDVFSWNKSRRN